MQPFLNVQTSKLACHPGHPYRNGIPIGQLWRLHPGRTCVVTSTCTGYAIRPKRAIDGRGLSTHKSHGIVGYSYPLQLTGRVFPARCPGRVLLWQVPFGQPSSLHPLRHGFPGVVRGLLRYYRAVRLPKSVRHRRASLDFPMRPEATAALGGRGISRFPCEVFPYVLGVSDRAGLWYTSRYRCTRWSLPHTPTASASRSECLSRLNTRPARSPVNASTPPSRAAPHDSGPMWVANPLSCDFCIHYNLAGLTGAQEITLDDPVSFAGVSQDGKRFALQVATYSSDHSIKRERFVIYSVDKGDSIAEVAPPQLPEAQSWTAF